MAADNKANIVNDVTNGIKTGASDTRAVDLRALLYKFLDSVMNFKDGGYLQETICGYTTEITLDDRKAWVHKGYVDDLVNPPVNPTLNPLTGGLFGTYEVGQFLPSGLQTIGYTVNDPALIKPQPPDVGVPSTSIPGATFPVNPFTLGSSGTFGITIAASTTKLTPGSYNVALQGQAVDLSYFSNSNNVTFLQRIFYGESPLTSLTESDIEALRVSQLKASFAGTYSFVAGNYKYFTYPSSMGMATSFINTANGLPVAMFGTVAVVSVTNAYGVTTNYNVHRTLNVLGGSINIAIS